jgi:hypothetical protein
VTKRLRSAHLPRKYIMATSFSDEAKIDLATRLGSQQAQDVIPELEQAIAACPTRSDFEQRIISQWREHLRELEAVGDDERAGKIERWFDYSGWGQKGRPRNETRWWLANVVGYILAWHGIRPTKSHTERTSGGSTGTFHQVLMHVIETVEGKSPDPDNVADLVSATVDLLGSFTPEEFEAVDFGMVGFMRLWHPRRPQLRPNKRAQ